MIKIIKKIKINKRGFTLIELLIIISIIGVLSGMITYIISSARAKARDAERVYTLRQFRTALELYYADHGTYLDAYNGSPDGMTWWAPYKYWKYEGGNCSTGFAQVAFDGNAVVIPGSRENTRALWPGSGSLRDWQARPTGPQKLWQRRVQKRSESALPLSL